MKKSKALERRDRFAPVKAVEEKGFWLPETADEMRDHVTLEGWYKAAWVWAMTTGSGRYDVKSLAAERIIGLQTPATVSEYRARWQALVDGDPALAVQPGFNPDSGQLPELPWLPTGHGNGGKALNAEYEAAAELAGVSSQVVRRTGGNKAAITAAIMADPEVERAVRTALIQKEIQRAREKGHITNRPDRDVEEAESEFNRIVIKMARIKRAAYEILALTLALRGLSESEKRAYVTDLVAEAQTIFTAIGEVAQGNSTDQELEQLLEQGEK